MCMNNVVTTSGHVTSKIRPFTCTVVVPPNVSVIAVIISFNALFNYYVTW